MIYEHSSGTGENSPNPESIENVVGDISEYLKKLEKESRRKLIEFSFTMFWSAWELDKEELRLAIEDHDTNPNPTLILGMVDPYEGLAEDAEGQRHGLVITLVDKDQYADYLDGGNQPYDFLYMVLPVDQSFQRDSLHREIPTTDELFVVEVQSGGDEPQIIYKHITREAAVDYVPFDRSLSDLELVLENPELISHLGEPRQENGYANRILTKLSGKYKMVPHTELDVEQRLTRHTAAYLALGTDQEI